LERHDVISGGALEVDFREAEMNCMSTVNPKTNSSPPIDLAREEIPAVLLVGGLGTRLQPILKSTPKPLARLGETSFLELLVRQLRSQGFRRLVMCTGHLAGQIEKEFGDGHKWDLTIEYSEESRPLGTAGAVKFAERHLQNDSDFLVMNGDSFMEIDFRQFIQFHREHGGLISMAVRRVSDASRFGTVEVDAHNRVVGFREKMGAHVSGIINAGVYLFNRAIQEHIPDGPASLEKDVFPRLLENGIYALELHGMFIDIGTPDDYARAQELHGSLTEASLRKPQIGPTGRQPR
jgi:NDP-sugar pyrophosphorylase family protein